MRPLDPGRYCSGAMMVQLRYNRASSVIKPCIALRDDQIASGPVAIGRGENIDSRYVNVVASEFGADERYGKLSWREEFVR